MQQINDVQNIIIYITFSAVVRSDLYLHLNMFLTTIYSHVEDVLTLL